MMQQKIGENKLSWVEEFRPKTFADIVGQDCIINPIREKMPNIPNLMLCGIWGTGKTCLAQVIVNELKADCKWINGSEQNGVNVMRSRKDGGTGEVDDFLRHVSLNMRAPKIIVLDEADGLSDEAQKLLRGKIEKYAFNSRFIITLNYEEKIIEPLQSRFKKYIFRPVEKEHMVIRLQYIADTKKIVVKDEELMLIAERSRGDFRRAINDLQMGDYGETGELAQIFSFAKG